MSESKNILIIAPLRTHPCNNGAVTKILNTAHILREAGYEIYYGYIQRDGKVTQEMADYWGYRLKVFKYRHPSVWGTFGQRWRARIRKWLPEGNYAFKRNASIDDWIDLSIEANYKDYLEEIQPCVVLCNYVWLSKVLQWTPPTVLRVIDTHDRFTNRYLVGKKANLPNDWFSTWPSEERKGLARSDRLLAISEDDHTFFKHTLQLHSFYHPPIISIHPKSNTAKPNILFIGNHNAPNTRGLMWFIETCWEKVTQKIPESQLLVVGGVCQKIGDYPNVIKMGYADDLESIYQSCKISINPVPSGSGIPIKCIESLSYHRPVVATSKGARGLDFFGTSCIHTNDTPEAFAKSVIAYLSDVLKWTSAVDQCAGLLRDWNEMSRKNLLACLKNEQLSHQNTR